MQVLSSKNVCTTVFLVVFCIQLAYHALSQTNQHQEMERLVGQIKEANKTTKSMILSGVLYQDSSSLDVGKTQSAKPLNTLKKSMLFYSSIDQHNNQRFSTFPIDKPENKQWDKKILLSGKYFDSAGAINRYLTSSGGRFERSILEIDGSQETTVTEHEKESIRYDDKNTEIQYYLGDSPFTLSGISVPPPNFSVNGILDLPDAEFTIKDEYDRQLKGNLKRCENRYKVSGVDYYHHLTLWISPTQQYRIIKANFSNQKGSQYFQITSFQKNTNILVPKEVLVGWTNSKTKEFDKKIFKVEHFAINQQTDDKTLFRYQSNDRVWNVNKDIYFTIGANGERIYPPTPIKKHGDYSNGWLFTASAATVLVLTVFAYVRWKQRAKRS